MPVGSSLYRRLFQISLCSSGLLHQRLSHSMPPRWFHGCYLEPTQGDCLGPFTHAIFHAILIRLRTKPATAYPAPRVFDVISRMLPGTHAKTGIQIWANSSFQHFHSQVQQVHFSITIWKKYLSEVMRISRTIIFHLSKLWKAKFFILCEVIFVVRLQEKIEILGNANCDAIRNGISQEKHTKQVQQTQWQLLCAIFYPICPS